MTRGFERAAAASVDFLASDAALDALRSDPYWPKWDSPWWHATLLWELGEAARIPERFAAEFGRKIAGHYLPFFPLKESELPPGKDPKRHVLCHCALGTAFQVLSGCGLDPDAAVPWARAWLLRYQLPDGGLNCDEAAYTGSRKSSFLSTLPSLEAILFCTRRPFTPEEEAFLDRGARYLLEHRLFRSTKGEVIDTAWLEPCFPRFYDYDLLRGLSFLSYWGAHTGKPWRDRAGEALEAAVRLAAKGFAPIQRPLPADKTLLPSRDGWVKGPAASFALLEWARRDEVAGPILEAQWAQLSCAGRC